MSDFAVSSFRCAKCSILCCLGLATKPFVRVVFEEIIFLIKIANFLFNN